MQTGLCSTFLKAFLSESRWISAPPALRELAALKRRPAHTQGGSEKDLELLILEERKLWERVGSVSSVLRNMKGCHSAENLPNV